MNDEELWQRARVAGAAWTGWTDAERADILAGKCDVYANVQIAYAALRDADKPLADLTRHPFEDQARELLAKAYEAKELEKGAAPLVRAGGGATEIAAMCAAYDAGLAEGGAA